MPLPEHYDDFDPANHDEEAERLEATLHQHWLDDLRNLQSEADAERHERNRPDDSAYGSLQKAFEAANPKPHFRDFEAVAEWEWRWLEYLYRKQGRERCLIRHHLERGSFVARHVARSREAQAHADALFEPYRERIRTHPPEPFAPAPWPEGDGVSEMRRELEGAADPADLAARQEAARREPSYEYSLDLEAGLIGWFQSLEVDDRASAAPLYDAARNCTSQVQLSYQADYSPGDIGRHLLYLRRGLGHAQDALDLLDACRGYLWLTTPAYTRLRSLLEAVRDASLDRYVALRAVYDGYLERAVRILGGSRWTATEEDGAGVEA